MSASLRFLAMAVIGWAGVRAATLGALPGTEGFTLGRAEAPPRAVAAANDAPAIVPTEFDAIEPAGAEILQSAAGEVPAPPPLVRAVASAAAPIYYYPGGIPGGARYASASLPTHGVLGAYS